VGWFYGKIRSGLDYFGVTDAGKKMMARGGGIRGDIISLFGGNPRKENLFQVFKRLGEDLIDHLKKKLDHAMELRGDAIKAIKFPALGGDISSMLSGIAGYLGNILTALVDPKAGVQASIRTNISQAGLRSMTQAQTEEEGPSRGRSTGWIKDTSVGDAALVETLNGKRRYSMLEGSVKGGMLQDNASGKYVVLRHGNYLVSYCHLSRILVGKGKQVSPAEPVGITGSTGRSTGEHLHVTCKLNGKSIDPRILFRHIKNIKDECVRALKDL
jgi:hypothetical protein